MEIKYKKERNTQGLTMLLGKLVRTATSSLLLATLWGLLSLLSNEKREQQE